jgi:pilus assembly protein Flp/PilA
MSKFAAAARRFVRDETGATMAEYALLIAVIALVAVAGARTLGTKLNDKLNAAASKVENNGV